MSDIGNSIENRQVATTKVYHCGTLTYTKVGLALLFVWLLWGDFCYTIMEAVTPSILPIKLKNLGTPNWLMGIIMTTGPGILNMTVCPWVSFKSDRFRSRWGRRIPFIVLTMPFLCLFLGMLGWSEEISKAAQHCFPALREYAPATITIALLGIFMIMFQFFNMFVGSVFWYFFNDVVPAEFLGRFMGAFKFVGIGAGAIYNWFIFKYAQTHMREIFTGTALLYFVGFGLVCLFVKEGKYPQLEGEQDKDNKGWGGLMTFFRESFTHRFYWYKFLSTSFFAMAYSIGIFSIFFQQEMGLNYEQIGKSTAISSVVTMVAVIFMATFVDRWHPLRLTTYASIFGVIGYSGAWVWLFVTLPGLYYFWIGIITSMAGAFLSAIVQTASLPCEMRIFPQSRFGQFCSAQALIRATCTCFSGILAGLFIDLMKYFCHGSDFAYRFNFAWSTIFVGLGTVFLVLVYLQWNRMGGDKDFHPPASWSPTGKEEMSITPTIYPQSRWLKIALRCYDLIMIFSILCIPAMAWWMQSKGQNVAAKYYVLVLFPTAILTNFYWRWLRGLILKDLNAAQKGTALINGIPHHGVLLLVGTKYLILLTIWIAELIVSVNMNLQSGAIAFGTAKIVSNILLITAIWVICRIERGFSVIVDNGRIKEYRL